jgi:hypothetical protein
VIYVRSKNNSTTTVLIKRDVDMIVFVHILQQHPFCKPLVPVTAQSSTVTDKSDQVFWTFGQMDM